MVINTPLQIVLANAALLAMGAFFPIIERILEGWDFYSATVARQLIGLAVLLPFLAGERDSRPLEGVPWSKVLVLGFIGVTVGSLLTGVGVLLSSGLGDHLRDQSPKFNPHRDRSLS